MLTLIVDTCLTACTAVIADEGQLVAAVSEDIGIGHAEHLAPIVARAFDEAGVSPTDIGLVASCVGPGSFMGVRVGISFAKGFALARNLPTRPVSTFGALAHSAPTIPQLVAIDAKRDQIYAQEFTATPKEPRLMSVEAAKAEFSHIGSAAAIGSGVDILWEDHNVDVLRLPSVTGLVRAVSMGDKGPLTPLYLRAPDAKKKAAAT